MQLLSQKVPVNHNLFLFGDFHIGTIHCHWKGIDKLINHMQSSIDGLPISSNIGLCHGDLIEAIAVDDKRYDLSAQGLPLEQAQDAVRVLWPIRQQLVCILMGNHELKLWRFGDLTKHICEQLSVPYGTYTCRVTYFKRGGDVLYKHYATHGRKSISSTADDPIRRDTNKKLILKRHLKNKAGDCVLQSKGHTHQILRLAPATDFYLSDDTKEIMATYIKSEENAEYIHPDLRWYVNTGSFLKQAGKLGMSSYSEIAEYDPPELGYYVLKFRNRIQEIEKVLV